jgi:hypothetical protein
VPAVVVEPALVVVVLAADADPAANAKIKTFWMALIAIEVLFEFSRTPLESEDS